MDKNKLNKPIEPYIEADGWYAICRNCYGEVGYKQEKCKCGQLQDWTKEFQRKEK